MSASAPRRLRLALTASAATLALLVTPGLANAQDAPEAPVEASAVVEPTAASQEMAGEVVDLTNDSRAKHDRKALRLDAKVSDYARRHAEKMAEEGSLFHTRKLARPLRGINWRYAGENVGVCYQPEDAEESCLADLQDAFMASPGHRRNILERRFDHVATGVYQKGVKVWVTVIFYG